MKTWSKQNHYLFAHLMLFLVFAPKWLSRNWINRGKGQKSSLKVRKIATIIYWPEVACSNTRKPRRQRRRLIRPAIRPPGRRMASPERPFPRPTPRCSQASAPPSRCRQPQPSPALLQARRQRLHPEAERARSPPSPPTEPTPWPRLPKQHWNSYARRVATARSWTQMPSQTLRMAINGRYSGRLIVPVLSLSESRTEI